MSAQEPIRFNVPIALPSDVTLTVEGVVMPSAGRVAANFSATYPAALGSVRIGYVQGILSSGVEVNIDGSMEIDGYIMLEPAGEDQQKVTMEIYSTKDGYALGQWNGTLCELPAGVKVVDAAKEERERERERDRSKLSEFKIRQPSPERSAFDMARSTPQVTNRFNMSIPLKDGITISVEGIVQQPSNVFAANFSATYPGALNTVRIGHISGDLANGIETRLEGPLELDCVIYYTDGEMMKVTLEVMAVRDGRFVQRWEGQLCELPPPPPPPPREERRRRR